MNKRFRRGLVVGKFSPLHRGHELIINQALDDCDELLVISYSKPEFAGCEPEKRERWLSRGFPAARVFVVTDEALRQFSNASEFAGVPANDDDESTHRRFCGFLCQSMSFPADAVFTSEDYGDAFARELENYFQRNGWTHKVLHVSIDRNRTRVPISATALRQDIHANRSWLLPGVYESFVKRICLLGGESSGKSTLSEMLARQFSTEFVREYGRELWESKNGKLCFDDMVLIAQRQISLEDEAVKSANEFLFCDTSPLTTLFYSQHLFGSVNNQLDQLAKRKYEGVVLCAPDFPFFQDGTRQPEAFRALQHEWYLTELTSRQVPFTLVTGTIADRVVAVERVLRGRS